MSDKLSAALTMREIENGFIVSGSLGVQYGKIRNLGETYYTTLAEVAKAVSSSIEALPSVVVELTEEPEEVKRK